MNELFTHLNLLLRPDAMRTVIRPFSPGDPTGFVDKDRPRSQRIVDRIMAMSDDELKVEMAVASKSLDERHEGVDAILKRRFEELDGLVQDRASVAPDRALLIGAYFSEEFAFESAALFNPSAVRAPDQSGVAEGDTRFVISLRGIGEGHVSSLTFRSGVWKADGSVEVDDASPRAVPPVIDRRETPEGETVVDLNCGGARDVSEAVIFPFMSSQGRGLEDVRLVEFTEEDGTVDIRGTATAFDGMEVRQVLLQTSDFKTIQFRGAQGALYERKGAALFPRRIDGRYFMLGRQDNENVWVLSSDDPYHWKDGGVRVITPRFPWEFVQMGNCGSPIELDEGWLVLTHGVGVVRNYCMGATLLDKKDPTKILARTPKPMMEPRDEDRDGYVPNVVYSCGAMLRGRDLLVPYGVADNFTSFATLKIDELLAAMI